MSRPLIRHGWSKRSGRIAAVPVLAGPHDTTNTSGYDFRKGQVNVKTLRVHQRPEWGCEGMTTGRATGC